MATRPYLSIGEVLTLLKDGHFFKDYTILGHHLPKAKLSRETTLGEIYGWQNEKKIRVDSENFSSASKCMSVCSRPSKST